LREWICIEYPARAIAAVPLSAVAQPVQANRQAAEQYAPTPAACPAGWIWAKCFTDSRTAELIEHEVRTLVGQRVFGIALGYEDLVDHDQLRHDPTMAVLAGKLSARRRDCSPLAGKSTLNRLELGGPELTRYHRIAWDGAKIEALFVDLFVEAHQHPPPQIILDLDATDDPLHGHQEGRFFHG
jgi:hypothetical protein